jgi:septum formation inhibitor-activating ATPase MinD
LLVPTASLQAHAARLAEMSNVRVLPDSVGITDLLSALQPESAVAGRPSSRRVARGSDDAGPRAPGASARGIPLEKGLEPGRLVVVTGCSGAGSSTTASNAGYAYGAAREVVLVDLDLARPSLVPLLNGDPSLGLAGILRAQQSGVVFLEQALDEHLQPLGDPRRSPHAQLLGGLPLDGSSYVVTADLVARLLDALTRRVSLVLVDVGHVPDSGERMGAAQRAALLAADGILVCSGANRVSVKRTQDYLARLVGSAPHVDPGRLALVLCRHEPRKMEEPSEIAELLGLPLAACVPADPRALEASGTALPLVARTRGTVAWALTDLADGLATGEWPPRPRARVALWRRVLEAIAQHARGVNRGLRERLTRVTRSRAHGQSASVSTRAHRGSPEVSQL